MWNLAYSHQSLRKIYMALGAFSSDATIGNGLIFFKRTLKTGHFKFETGPYKGLFCAFSRYETGLLGLNIHSFALDLKIKNRA